MIKGKKIVLGITGSIAVYKACEIASKFTQQGAHVHVVMTKSATEFVSPLTFRSLTGNAVTTEMWDLSAPMSVEHVALAQLADVVLIAPATANTIAKLAAGIADDMLTCTVLATKAPVIVAPAMNANMFDNPVTKENIQKLIQRGFIFVEPDLGWLACGIVGKGRLADVDQIMGITRMVLGRNGDLMGKKIVITAGGTQEPIDPVRHISNRSSGKMGYAIAVAARDRGAQVILVSAPVSLKEPEGVEVIKVRSAQDMFHAVGKAVIGADALIKAAAVADYRPAISYGTKLKKSEESISLPLEKTVDILSAIEGNFVRVGFAAENQDLIENAKIKLSKKNLDLIIANDINIPNSAMEAENNQVVIIDRVGNCDHLPLMPKSEVAEKILDRVANMIAKSRSE